MATDHDAFLAAMDELIPLRAEVRALRARAAANAELLRCAEDYRTMVRPHHGDSCECNPVADALDAAIAAAREAKC